MALKDNHNFNPSDMAITHNPFSYPNHVASHQNRSSKPNDVTTKHNPNSNAIHVASLQKCKFMWEVSRLRFHE